MHSDADNIYNKHIATGTDYRHNKNESTAQYYNDTHNDIYI